MFLGENERRNYFESLYEQTHQIAVAGTNHTVTTTNSKTIQKKSITKPLKPIPNPISKWGEGARGPDRRFGKTKPEDSPCCSKTLDTTEEQMAIKESMEGAIACKKPAFGG